MAKLKGGKGADRLEGTDQNDELDGRRGADEMLGGKGDDLYKVDNAGDVVVELHNAGLDWVWSAVDYRLGEYIENLNLTDGAHNGWGNALDNRVHGNAADNVLYAYEGVDDMTGAGGNDLLYAGEGDDFAEGGDGADCVDGEGGNDRLVGGNEADVLNGGTGDDVLKGASGADRLDGGLGLDRLDGGAGGDVFVFNVAPGEAHADTILRFDGEDFIELGSGQYAAFLGAGELSEASFYAAAGAEAQNAEHRILYDTATGALYYDADGADGADGAGGAAQLRFATILEIIGNFDAGDIRIA